MKKLIVFALFLVSAPVFAATVSPFSSEGQQIFCPDEEGDTFGPVDCAGWMNPNNPNQKVVIASYAPKGCEVWYQKDESGFTLKGWAQNSAPEKCYEIASNIISNIANGVSGESSGSGQSNGVEVWVSEDFSWTSLAEQLWPVTGVFAPLN